MTPVPVVYKIVAEEAWREAEFAGRFVGAGIDLQDGYIHFSTGAQAPETAARHFAGHTGLLLVAVAVSALGNALRWEPSRGGALFPHLYAPLSLDAVEWVMPLPLGPAGRHQFPRLDEDRLRNRQIIVGGEAPPSHARRPGMSGKRPGTV